MSSRGEIVIREIKKKGGRKHCVPESKHICFHIRVGSRVVSDSRIVAPAAGVNNGQQRQ